MRCLNILEWICWIVFANFSISFWNQLYFLVVGQKVWLNLFLDVRDPSNYRGIAISSYLSKLFVKILCNRLDVFVTENNILCKNQIGFRKANKTIDHVYTLKSIVDKMFRAKKYLYCCFVDFRKAFDTVWRNFLFS